MRDKLARLLVLSCTYLALGGCATSMEFGTPPATDRLSELKWNVSTAEEVRKLLGEPQGRGATLSTTYGLKDAWYYWSMKFEGQQGRSRMLMVIMDKDLHLYQGHLWVTSTVFMDQAK